MTVKSRLVAWRKSQGWSQREAAKRAGVSQAAWQSYENEDSTACPGINAALAIAELTKTTGQEIPVEAWREADIAKVKRKAIAAAKRVVREAKSA